MNITLTGATGFIGKRVTKALVQRGDRVTILTRKPRSGDNPRYVVWDARSDPPAHALETDAVIHLAGESVAQRWTPEVKQRIRSSRIDATRALVRGITASRQKPRVLVSASAIGFYGPRGDDVLTEESPAGSGFLEDVSVQWEQEAQRAEQEAIRVVNPRIGIVLGPDGGALERMLAPFKMGVGGRLGSGQQWMSWVHIDDIVGLILFALDRNDVRGPLNATAPNPVRNVEFTKQLGNVLNRPTIFPVPVIALKLLFGEMADVLIWSQRVLPRSAMQHGYSFRFPDLRPALQSAVRGT